MALNLATTYIDFVKDSSIKYAKLILDKKYDKEIFTSLLDTYISVRYYNDYEMKNKNFSSNINYYLKEKALSLLETFSDKKDKIEACFHIYKYLLLFDDVDDYKPEDIIDEILEYKSILNISYEETFSDDFINLVKENNKKKKDFLDGFDTNRFKLNNKKTSKKNLFYMTLDFDIKFPRIYSSYSINKVYNTGLVNEDKLFILYYLVSREIMNDSIKGIFNKEYIVDFPLTILEKKEKINRLFSIIDSELIKNNLILKFDYKDYILNQDLIKSWITDGYKISIVLDDSFENSRNNEIWLDIFSYIITSKDKAFSHDKKIVIE